MKIKDSFDRLSVCASVCVGLYMQVSMVPGMQVLTHMRAYACVNKGYTLQCHSFLKCRPPESFETVSHRPGTHVLARLAD